MSRGGGGKSPFSNKIRLVHKIGKEKKTSYRVRYGFKYLWNLFDNHIR